MYDVGFGIYMCVSVENMFWYFLFPLQIIINLNSSVHVYLLIGRVENGTSRERDSYGSVRTVRYCVWFVIFDWSTFFRDKSIWGWSFFVYYFQICTFSWVFWWHFSEYFEISEEVSHNLFCGDAKFLVPAALVVSLLGACCSGWVVCCSDGMGDFAALHLV